MFAKPIDVRPCVGKSQSRQLLDISGESEVVRVDEMSLMEFRVQMPARGQKRDHLELDPEQISGSHV